VVPAWGGTGLLLTTDDFQILSPLPFFNQSKKIPMVSDTRPLYLKLLARTFEFPPSYRVT